jgi:tRNA dimethylallyltransferase
MENILFVLPGPTGVGKTETAIALALRFGCDIISADSRQFYREMSIGTAVPSPEQLNAVKHHFIRFLPVDSYYSSSLFERDVLLLLPELFKKNRIAIMTGGSGMYIDAVCEGSDSIPDVDPGIRESWLKRYNDEGLPGLRKALSILDPVHYSRVDLKNPKRIIRALEICESTGKPYSSFLKKAKAARDFRVIKAGLKRSREELYARINARVDTMIAGGLEDEARALLPFREFNALNTVGYRELFSYFDAGISREEAIELIKRNTRRYAKRQLTWWSRDRNIKWFHPDQTAEIGDYIAEAASL